ncbi:MAG TPA: hypothetical protein VFJ87_05715 [Rhodanobacteraceae bacterium]|jgi:NAD kinase|nr:hypothetical protein [Rhodanobacteraceae bacterium]
MDALDRRIVLVVRHTRLEDLIVRFNTIEQARFYIEHLGADFSDYETEHHTYQEAIRVAEATLRRFGRVQRLDRTLLPNFLFAPDATIVVLGQDGLVANTLKYLDGQPVIGVNPDPARWDGVLLPFEVPDLAKVVPDILSDKRQRKRITMAQAKLSDGPPTARTNSLHILYSGVETFPVRKTPVPRITAVAQRPSRDGDRIPVTQYQNSIVDRGCCSQLENCPREVARPSG